MRIQSFFRLVSVALLVLVPGALLLAQGPVSPLTQGTSQQANRNPTGKQQQNRNRQDAQKRREEMKKRMQNQQGKQRGSQAPQPLRGQQARRRDLSRGVGFGDVGTTVLPVQTNTVPTSGSKDTTGTVAGSPQAGAVARELIESLDPEDRRAVIAYFSALTDTERQAFRRQIGGLRDPEARKEKLLELARSGKADMDSIEPASMLPGASPAAVSTQAGSRQESSANRASGGRREATLPGAGEIAPPITAETLDGKPVSLESFKGKPLVLEFGSITCPVYRGKIGQMAELQRKYGSRVGFLMVYTVEAHPSGSTSPYADREWVTAKNEQEGVLKAQPSTLGERKQLAAEVATKHGEAFAVAIDRMDNATWAAYGSRPNSLFVIGANGQILAAQVWADADSAESLLKAMFNPLPR